MCPAAAAPIVATNKLKTTNSKCINVLKLKYGDGKRKKTRKKFHEGKKKKSRFFLIKKISWIQIC